MSQLKRHIGRLKNTDRKIVVIYMQIPGKESSALIVDTDALPDQFHEFLMKIVESEAGQTTVNLADVLDRRASPDAGMNLMNSLHRRGYLRAEPIDNIIMFPRPNMPFPLSQVIQLTKKEAAPAAKPEEYDGDRFNQFTENMKYDDNELNVGKAKSLLYDAELLQQEVKRKQNEAYKIAPSLKPQDDGRFSLPQPEQTAKPRQTTFAPDIPDEYKEIMERAQEHLERAVYREEHGEPLVPLEMQHQDLPKKTSTAPKKKASVRQTKKTG